MKKKLLALLLAAAMVLEGTGILTVQAAITNSSMDTAIEMELDTALEVTLEDGETAYHKFTPEVSGWYTFSSSVTEEVDYTDTYGELLDTNGELLTSNDDYYDKNQFGLSYELEGGTTYYLLSRQYNMNAGHYYVNVSETSSLVASAVNSNVTVTYGDKATLSVNAYSKDGTITYRWYYNNENNESVTINDATGSSYEITANKDTQDWYVCEVSDGTNTVNVGFNVIVDTGLASDITDGNITIPYGESAVLTANTTGGLENLTYRWCYFDDTQGDYTDITGATSQTYEVTADANTKYNYRCYVSDGVSEVACDFYITVDSGLELEYTYKDVVVTYGKTKELSVNVVDGNGTYTYQWYYYAGAEGYIAIDGATSSTYTITADESTYTDYMCTVSDGIASRDCNFYITIDSGLVLETTIQSYEVVYGNTKELSVDATGGMGSLTYQWYYYSDEEGFVAIEGATSSTYTITANESTYADYMCTVSDGIASKSCNFYITVNTGWDAEGSGYTQYIPYGKTKTLTVTTTETDRELKYQWYYDENGLRYEIDGATGSSYDVVADSNMKESYLCMVTDGIMTKNV